MQQRGGRANETFISVETIPSIQPWTSLGPINLHWIWRFFTRRLETKFSDLIKSWNTARWQQCIFLFNLQCNKPLCFESFVNLFVNCGTLRLYNCGVWNGNSGKVGNEMQSVVLNNLLYTASSSESQRYHILSNNKLTNLVHGNNNAMCIVLVYFYHGVSF